MNEHPGGLGELRRSVTEAVSSLLEVRAAGRRGRVLGAGSDDFDSGRRYLATLAEGGYAVPTWPVGHGGMGVGRAEADVVAEVLGGFERPDLYPFLVGLELIGPTILAHGTDAQKAAWLPRIRSGEDIWCQAFSEPDAGSDLANLKARAERHDDGWRLSGSKVWTSRAHYSQRALLLARSDPSVPKHAGITAFGLDMASPGVTVRPLVQMNGDTHFNEVFLDDVVVADSDRLGAAGEGWRVGLTCLSFERGSLAGDLGVSVDQLRSLADATELRQRPAAYDQLVRSVLAVEVNRLAGLRAQEARLAGRPPGPEDSGAKLRTNAMIKQIASAALAAEGPGAVAGTGDEDLWRTMLLVSPSLSIRGGTDEIQRNILGERVLGLPPEPRVDKGHPFTQRPDR